MDRVGPVILQLDRALEQPLFAVEVERGDRRRRRQRVGAVGIAVEQLNPGGGIAHHGIVDLAPHCDRAHRHGGVGQPLGHGDEVGRDPEPLRRGRPADPAEGGDHFVEDQQDIVPIADVAQPLEIALRRDQHPGRARHRLDNHRRDRVRPVERDNPFQVIRQLRPVLRQAAREGVAGKVVGVAHVVDPRQQGAELAPVADNPAGRDSAGPDPVVASLAPDQPGPSALPARPLVGECGRQRCRRFPSRSCRRRSGRALPA